VTAILKHEANGQGRAQAAQAAPSVVAPAFDPSGIDVLAFAARERRNGKPVCIATVTEIYGTSPRARGAQMAVAEDGRSAGHVSSGCLERAIVAEAQAAMKEGKSRLVRYGQGSQYVDIALPCGSALQVLFSVAPPLEALDAALDAAEARRPFALDFDLETGAGAFMNGAAPAASGHYVRAYAPRLRVIAAGQGAELTTVTRVVRAAGYDMVAVSPDEAALAFCAQQGAQTVRLRSAGGPPDLPIDEWTAVVLLFHEREWEVPILTRALVSPAFYVGAVGSRRTAAARLEDLFAAGVSPDEAARLRGPIGLLASTRDPAALALSALTEIVAAAPAA
jgi:xanthine dehydrogenase accessory factor